MLRFEVARILTLARSADFQVGCVADFQIRETGKALRALALRCAADLEIGDTAGLETRATGAVADAPFERAVNKFLFRTRGFVLNLRCA